MVTSRYPRNATSNAREGNASLLEQGFDLLANALTSNFTLKKFPQFKVVSRHKRCLEFKHAKDFFFNIHQPFINDQGV